MNLSHPRSKGAFAESTPPRVLAEFAREFATQDWIVVGYLALLYVLTVLGTGPRRHTALVGLSVDIAAVAAAFVLSRGKILRGAAGAFVYRLGLVGAVFGSFIQLQYILPTARSVTLDGALYAFDKRVFGFEPTELLDRWVSTTTVEWFSFFYFGYFVVLVVHVLPLMFGVNDDVRARELALGLVLLFCCGHVLYIVVPGYGPYRYLADHFVHPIDGPVWWPAVRAAVDAGEVRSRTDIFPSLHTAAPTFLALFSIRHRRRFPFSVSWVPMVFVASQIMISTMFLRWHYLIDVLAGLALAAGVATLAPRIVRWESARRAATGRSAALPPLRAET
jgi:membrane-associated phospholipid phosphatase